MIAPRSRAAVLVLTAHLLRVAPLPAQAPATPPAPTSPTVLGSRAPYRILLDQLSGSIEVRTPGGDLRQSWSASARAGGKAALARIPAGTPVDVEIVNANPLLYRYDLQTAVVARRPLPACRNLGSRLALTGALTSFATVATATQPLLTSGIAPLFQPPPAASEETTRGPATPTAAELDLALREHRAPVERYAGFLTAVRRLSQTLADSIALLAELAESQPLDSLVLTMQGSLDQAYPGLGRAAQVPLTVREQSRLAEPHVAALTRLTQALERGSDEPAGSGVEIMRLMGMVEEAQKDFAAVYRGLQVQLLRLEAARSASRQVFSTDGSNDVRRLTLSVEPTPDWPAVFRARVGRKEVYTEPSVSFLCQVSLGVAFMDRPPEYGVEGGNVVNRASSQRTGITVMLHLASAQVPLIGALAGLGFGSGDMPDLYAGGSVRLLDPMMVNFGAVWQRTEQLPRGYSEGQPVADPAPLVHLPRKYEVGFFWGVSIAR